MPTSAFWAPVHRLLQRSPVSQPLMVPPNAAPSLDYLSSGLQDHRLPYDKYASPTGIGVIGWHGAGDICVIDQVPSTIATNNIAAAAAVNTGVAMTKVSVTGAGITVLATATRFWPSLTLVPAAACVIDVTPAQKKFGPYRFNTSFYDRTTMIARAVSITATNAGATGGNFTVAGYDVYGYAMSEVLTHAGGATTKNGKKAFKVVVSITPAFTDAQTYSVGTTDIYGFGIQAPLFSDVQIWYNSAVITASTGFVVPDTTSPATTTTGDVRGTYAAQSASDNTKRLVILVRPPLGLITTNSTTGLFGVAQV